MTLPKRLKQRNTGAQKRPPDLVPSGPPEMPVTPGPGFPELPEEEPEIRPSPEPEPKTPQEIPSPEKKYQYGYPHDS